MKEKYIFCCLCCFSPCIWLFFTFISYFLHDLFFFIAFLIFILGRGGPCLLCTYFKLVNRKKTTLSYCVVVFLVNFQHVSYNALVVFELTWNMVFFIYFLKSGLYQQFFRHSYCSSCFSLRSYFALTEAILVKLSGDSVL